MTALESNPNVPKLETVTERLLHEERKMRDGESNQKEEEALFMKQGKRNHGLRCYGCHKFGHIQRNCPESSQNLDKSSNKNSKAKKSTKKKESKDREMKMEQQQL